MVDLTSKKCKCGKKCYYNYQGNPPEFCSECKINEMINVRDKKCKCGKARPIFNYEGLSPEFCSLCKTTDMNDVKNTRCNCKKALPSFNFEGLQPKFCISCKKEGMMNVKVAVLPGKAKPWEFKVGTQLSAVLKKAEVSRVGYQVKINNKNIKAKENPVINNGDTILLVQKISGN